MADSSFGVRETTLELLRSSDIFAILSPEEAEEIARELVATSVSGQDVLFRQGEAGDSLYLVESGRLQAVQTDANGRDVVLGEVGAGEVIGEIALVTGEPRMATMRAIRDSRLLRLSRESFDRLARPHFGIFMRVARVIVERLRRASHDRPLRPMTFTVVPLEPGAPIDAFTDSFLVALRSLGDAVRVDARWLERELGDGAATIERGQPRDEAIIERLGRIERENLYVLYVAEASSSAWTRRCLRQADRILLLADASGDPEIGEIERTVLPTGVRAGAHASVSLVLVHPADATRAAGTARWLERRNATGHFHVRRDRSKDFERLARLLTERAYGLALSGGGSRSVAHIGVIRALTSAGIPIDVVSGSSAGAAVAAMVAMELSPKAQLERSNEILKGRLGHLLRLGPPISSLMSGSYVEQILQPVFRNENIEDLFVPFFAVSTSVTENRVYIHRRGSVWLAVRASSSLPGIWPPVALDGQLLVDGGVLNNLPVDVLEPFCRQGTIMASDLAQEVHLPALSHSTLSGWRLLAQLLFRRKRMPPWIYEIIESCMVMASKKHRSDLAVKIDLHLTPDVNDYGMFDVHGVKTLAEVEGRGYRHTVERLRDWASVQSGSRAARGRSSAG